MQASSPSSNALPQRSGSRFSELWIYAGLCVFIPRSSAGSTPPRSATADRPDTRNRRSSARTPIVRQIPEVNIWKSTNWPNSPIMAMILKPLYRPRPAAARLGILAARQDGDDARFLLARLPHARSARDAVSSLGKGSRRAPDIAAHRRGSSHGNVNLFILLTVVSCLYAYRRGWDVTAGLASRSASPARSRRPSYSLLRVEAIVEDVGRVGRGTGALSRPDPEPLLRLAAKSRKPGRLVRRHDSAFRREVRGDKRASEPIAARASSGRCGIGRRRWSGTKASKRSSKPSSTTSSTCCRSCRGSPRGPVHGGDDPLDAAFEARSRRLALGRGVRRHRARHAPVQRADLEAPRRHAAGAVRGVVPSGLRLSTDSGVKAHRLQRPGHSRRADADDDQRSARRESMARSADSRWSTERTPGRS